MRSICASLLLICLSGCYKLHQEYTVCADGSGQVRVSLAMNRELAEHDGDLDALHGLLRSFEGVRWQPLRHWRSEDGWLHYEQVGSFADIRKLRNAEFERFDFSAEADADGFLLSVTPRPEAAERWADKLPLDDGPPDASDHERAEFLRLVRGFSLGFSFHLPGQLDMVTGNTPRVAVRGAQTGGFLLDESNWDFRPTRLDFAMRLSARPGDSLQLAADQALQAEVRRQLQAVPPLRIALDGNLSPDFIQRPAAEGCLLLTPYLPVVEEDSPLPEAGQQSIWSALAWDAVGLVAQAMRAEGCSREGVQRGLLGMELPWPGAAGDVRFDEQGRALRVAGVAVVVQGRQQPAVAQLGPTEEPRRRPQPAAAEATGAPLRIGLAVPLSGPAAAFGEEILRGARLQVAALNRAGGLEGRPLELRIVDDTGDLDRAREAAAELCADPELLAVIGHFSSATSLAAASAYADAGLVMLSPAASDPHVAESSEWSFQLMLDDARMARAAIALAAVVHQRNRVLVLTDASLPERCEEALHIAASNFDVELKLISFARERVDFAAIAQQAAAFAPDAVVLHTLAHEGGLLLEALREQGLGD